MTDAKLRPEELEFIQFLKSKNIQRFIDVGANEGNYTDSIIKHLNPPSICVYEPIESCYQNLCDKYVFGRPVVYDLIVSDTEGEVEFNEAIGHSELSSCVNRDWLFKDFEMKKTLKKSIRLDSLHNLIDFLKIDTEGYELKVLKGCEELLSSKSIRYIQFEYGGCFKDIGIKMNDVIEYLRTFDYGVYSLEGGKFTLIENFEDDYEWKNYFAFYEYETGTEE